jgi:alpha-galactosidase
MAFKLVFIGAGSIGFTRGLLTDLLSVPEFKDVEIAFVDINKKNLEMVGRLCQRDIEANGLKIRIVRTTDRRQALRGAKYVINCTRIGGLEAFATDIEIPLAYGIDQCVGDTLCAGGIMYGQRGIAAMLDFCKDIREVAAPGCLVLNYGNPNAMLTWAANAFGGVRCVGLCHGVQGGHWQLAQVIQHVINNGRPETARRFVKVSPREVDIICAGINHQTWYTRALYQGVDWANSPRLLKGFETHPVFSKTEKVRIDMLRRFGYYSTESNGHLSEYVPWYRKNLKTIKNWISLDSWINGETGGYLRVCTESRNWFETDFPNWMKAKPAQYGPDKRGQEHGSYIIESLETGRIYRGHFNVVNRGAIANLPDDAIVEVPGYVDHSGISIPQVGDLPLGCAAVCNASISVQRLAVLAAVTGDITALRQAMMLDPLVGAVCEPPAIWQMTDEMLVAGAPWLPQYRKAIAGARARLAHPQVKTDPSCRGAARLKTKTVLEMRRDRVRATRLAAAADKAH